MRTHKSRTSSGVSTVCQQRRGCKDVLAKEKFLKYTEGSLRTQILMEGILSGLRNPALTLLVLLRAENFLLIVVFVTYG